LKSWYTSAMNTIITNVVYNVIYVKLFMAAILGMAIGVERFVAHKTAGMRTYTLVSLGAAMFVIISQLVTQQYGLPGYDFHLVAAIVSAAGFLGVGSIIRSDMKVIGITTATGLWVATSIGMACGFGLYKLAAIATMLTLFVFIVLWFVEKQIGKLGLVKTDEPTE
jgi:putative Mg2+ transporter-C (MgtC) family protein